MADEGLTPASDVAVTEGQKPDVSHEQQTYSADYVKALREEAKQTRLQLKTVSGELEQLRTVAGDSKALQEQIGKIGADLAKAQADAVSASQRADLVRLAVKANVPIELAEMLDLSKLDLTDEKKALEQLGKLGVRGTQSPQVKPGATGSNGMTDADMRAAINGANRSASLFGG